MSQLIQAFINAVDSDGNIARINIAQVTQIEGKCASEEYNQNDDNRTIIRSTVKSWHTRETPEDIYKLICYAQDKQLQQLKNTRLVSLPLLRFNALARFHDEDNCVNYIPTDSIIRFDDEYELVQIVTQHHGALSCTESINELTAAIESAERAHITKLQKHTLGIR